MTTPPDELLERALGGDNDALADLIEAVGPGIRDQIAARIGKLWQSVLDADDVMQVTYLEVFLRIHQFAPQGPGAFSAWLSRVAENNLRDAIRELGRAKRPHPRRRTEPRSQEDSCVALLEMVGVSTTTPSRHAARGEAVSLLDSALSALPRDYETAIRLYDLEGRSMSETAAEMGRSPGAVHMLRARAHDCLRDALGSGSQFFSHGA